MQVTLDALPPEPGRWLTKDELDFIFEGRAVRHCLDCILVQEGGVLLAMRKIPPFLDHWTLPGGMQRWRETQDQAFIRIVSKELGIKPISRKLVGAIEHLHDGPLLHSVSLAYVVKEWEGQFRGSEQGKEFRFFAQVPEGAQPYQAAFLEKNWDAIMA